jgi:hypothetical protein
MSSIELGELNLKQGKHAVAFDIFFELAQFELSADAQFALVKMCSEGLLNTEQVESLMSWLNREVGRGNGYADYNVGLIHEKESLEARQTSRKLPNTIPKRLMKKWSMPSVIWAIFTSLA